MVNLARPMPIEKDRLNYCYIKTIININRITPKELFRNITPYYNSGYFLIIFGYINEPLTYFLFL